MKRGQTIFATIRVQYLFHLLKTRYHFKGLCVFKHKHTEDKKRGSKGLKGFKEETRSHVSSSMAITK